MDWNFATAFEVIADTLGDKPALISKQHTRNWTEYDNRAAKIAAVLKEHGLSKDSKVGIYLHNSNEYLESHTGVLKLRACPINVNYRYQEDELVYLLNNADAEAVIFQSNYAERIQGIQDRLEKVKCYIQVQDSSNKQLIPGALDYETILSQATPMARINRAAEDIYMLYTGGTTGMPKGVLYANGEQCASINQLSSVIGAAPAETIADLPKRLKQAKAAEQLPVSLVCCPLMHGTGIWVGAMMPHLAGGSVVTISDLGLDPSNLWRHAEQHNVTLMTIVGDAFARPLLQELDAAAETNRAYDLSSISHIISSGVMWSEEVKNGLLRHKDFLLIDAMGSSEGSMGISISSRASISKTAKFQTNNSVRVFTDDNRAVQPGSGEIGMVGTQSAMRGYYKDPEKTATILREIDGVRWVFPGDYAQIEEDGTLTLLGRGSMCINSAGEKIFPEEVEEAMKANPAVQDCLVVGVPDDRFGEKVIALVSLIDTEAKEQDLITACKQKISAYKCPKKVITVNQVQRAPNGKADYKWAKATALAVYKN